MATRSTIALEFADGTVQQVYCHWDGYLEHNGRILQGAYMDPFKVRDLIDLGDLSSLGLNLGEKHDFDCPHKYGTPEYEAWSNAKHEMCTFYGRDRGETGCEARKFVDFQDYLAHHQYEEYEYILRQVAGQPVWFVKCHDAPYVPLVEALAFEEVAA